MLAAALCLCAVLAGVAGSWSPCGFSMVETLAPREQHRHRPNPLALATFTVGALLGGALMLGGLSALGAALGMHGTAAAVTLASVAILAALTDVLGLPVLPQVRRQVPESWRRRLPLPVAGGLYGVLLGLGCTTFVLACSVWALMLVALAKADITTGLAAGLAFGAGRALPVLILSRDAERAGERVGERPGLLRALRAAAAIPLLGAAAALAASPASAATVISQNATDPTVDGAWLAYHAPGGLATLTNATQPYALPQSKLIAVGGSRIAALSSDGATLNIYDQANPASPFAAFPAPGADAVAVSSTYVVWRVHDAKDEDILYAQSLLNAAEPARELIRIPAPGQVGRPSLDTNKLVFHLAGRKSSRIMESDLAQGTLKVIRTAKSAQFLNPTISGQRLLYVRITYRDQQLRLGAVSNTRNERALYKIPAPTRRDKEYDPGHPPHPGVTPGPRPPTGNPKLSLWTTALGPRHAYVTRISQTSNATATATLLRVDR